MLLVMSQFQLTWQPFNTQPGHFLRFPLCLPAVRMCVLSTNLEIELMQLNPVWTSCTCEWPHVLQDVVDKAVCSVDGGAGGGLGWLPISERHWLLSIFNFLYVFVSSLFQNMFFLTAASIMYFAQWSECAAVGAAGRLPEEKDFLSLLLQFDCAR